jgi:hypothetical protein
MTLIALSAIADGPPRTAKKSITKKFAAGTIKQLIINNQYGDVKIKGWKQKQTVVAISIVGKADRLPRAAALVKLVRISFEAKAGMANLETMIDTTRLRAKPGEECHINYEIFTPNGLSLSIKNVFGNIDAADFNGSLAVDEKFGDFKARNLTGPLQFSIQQGNLDVDRLLDASLDMKGFNAANIGNLGKNVDLRFSSGGSVNLNLSAESQNLKITADNVKPIRLSYLKQANADLKVHTMLSKFVYNDRMMLKVVPLKQQSEPPDTAVITIEGKSDTSKKDREKIISEKKKRLNIIYVRGMKTQDFEVKTGTGENPIKVDVSFCVLNVKD